MHTDLCLYVPFVRILHPSSQNDIYFGLQYLETQ